MNPKFLIAGLVLAQWAGAAPDNVLFHETARRNIGSIEAGQTELEGRISRFSGRGSRKAVEFRTVSSRFRQLYDSASVDTSASRAEYHRHAARNAGATEWREDAFTTAAFSELSRLPSPLTEAEATKVLYVKYEKSIHQERAADGSIDPQTNLRTHQAVVKIGRTLHGLPVFNSFATIGIDAVDGRTNYFDLRNWKSIGSSLPGDLRSRRTSAHVESKIRSRLDALRQDQPTDYDHVQVDEVVSGWNLDPQGNAVPAVIVKGQRFSADSDSVGKEFTTVTEL